MKKFLLKLFSYIIVFTLIYIIIKNIDFIEVYKHIKYANHTYLIISFLIISIGFLLWALRWNIIIKQLKKVNYLTMFPIFLTGLLINTITPSGRMGGEPIKTYYLAKRYKLSRSKAFATTIADKIYNLIIFFALCSFSILFIAFNTHINFYIKIILVILPSLVALILIFPIIAIFNNKLRTFLTNKILPLVYKFYLFKTFLNKFESYDHLKSYVVKKLDKFLRFLKKVLRNKKITAKCITITILFWICTYLSVYFIFLSLGQKISIIPIIIVVTLSLLFGDISFLPGGIGLIEGLMIVLYLTFGINPDIAIVVTVLTRIMFYFYALGLGTLSFLYLTLKIIW